MTHLMIYYKDPLTAFFFSSNKYDRRGSFSLIGNCQTFVLCLVTQSRCCQSTIPLRKNKIACKFELHIPCSLSFLRYPSWSLCSVLTWSFSLPEMFLFSYSHVTVTPGNFSLNCRRHQGSSLQISNSSCFYAGGNLSKFVIAHHQNCFLYIFMKL